MKNLAKASLWILLTGVMMFTANGCGEQKKETSESQQLVVERQYAKLDGFSPFDWAECVVDVPVKGPRPLVDSINAFLNAELYSMLEVEDDSKRFSAKEVYTDDMSNLVTKYADKYREYLKEHLEWFATYNLFVISQTESFVTYGIECYHGAASTGSEFTCRTFSKKDGHSVEIITADDMLRFYEDQEIVIPELLEWKLKSEDGYSWNPFEVGLVDDGMLIGNVSMHTHYEQDFLPYSDILPYLSKDAQNLVKNMGKSSNWEECFVGERLAKVNTSNNNSIVLTVRPAKHDWTEIVDCIDSESDDYGMTNNLCYGGHDLMAFYVENGEYTPANVLDGDSIITRSWDGLYTTNPSEDVFSFDPPTDKLYVPYAEHVMMGKHDCNDRYSVYRYIGFGFVYEGEDGGFWLHPSLRQFGRLWYAMKTKEYLIRIDEMRIYDDLYDDQYEADRVDTCRYRLAVWNNKSNTPDVYDYNMLDNPDLVIYNGYIDGYIDHGFVFLNNGYRYVIKISDSDSDDEGWLLVYKGDKLIYKGCLRSFDFESVLSFDWDCEL